MSLCGNKNLKETKTRKLRVSLTPTGYTQPKGKLDMTYGNICPTLAAQRV